MTGFSAAIFVVMAAVMLYLAVKDIRERRVPNKAIIFLVALWILWRGALIGTSAIADPTSIPFEDIPSGAHLSTASIISAVPTDGILVNSVIQLLTAVSVLITLVVIGRIYERIRKRPAMGGGDVKLIAVLALYLGPTGLAICVMAACLIALVFQIAHSVQRNPLRYGIPFATCLSCGMFIAFLLL